MQKQHYFDLLESLAELSHKSVRSACGDLPKNEAPPVRAEADRLLCDCEKALFSDFLPPLERHSIAICAHSLVRIVREAEALSHTAPLPGGGQQREEYTVCIPLSLQVTEEIPLLRSVRKPYAKPNLPVFREKLAEASMIHDGMQRSLAAGTLPRSASEAVRNLIALRKAIASAFDTLVEVMLMNI